MADQDTRPVHEIRPTTQELRIPQRYIPQPIVEPSHTFATITDHISSIVLRKKTPLGWLIGFMVGVGAYYAVIMRADAAVPCVT